MRSSAFARFARRFATHSGRRPLMPQAPMEPPVIEPPLEPEPRLWPSPPRRWPWRRATRTTPARERRPAPGRREEQPEFPVFRLSERFCESCGRPISRERLRAIPTATQCVDCKRADLEEAVDDPEIAEHEAPAPAEPPREERVGVAVEETSPHVTTAETTREWNLWELERLARRLGGGDMARDDEWTFLLIYLREFANPAGVLPADFDALVREAFPELVVVVEEA